MPILYDVIVVGGGPAGLTAANNTALRGLKTLIIETHKKVGGKPHQFYPQKIIHDHPGFPDGIAGEELTKRLWQQAKKSGVVIKRNERMAELFFDGRLKIIKTPKHRYRARAVILCTGLLNIPRKLPQLKDYKGKGLHTVVRVPERYKGRYVVVVGAGDNAFDNACTLSKFARSVTILCRDSTPHVKLSSVKRVKRSKVKILYNTELKSIIKHRTRAKAIIIVNRKTSEEKTIRADAIVVNIGFIHSKKFLRDLGLSLHRNGSVMVDKNMKTNLTGVFAAGDITGDVNLIAVACASGIKAALSVFRYLRKEYVLHLGEKG